MALRARRRPRLSVARLAVEGVRATDVEAELERIGHELRPGDVVLVHTGTNLKEPGYDLRHAGLRRDATEFLVDRGVRLIGIDAWGLDRPFDVMAEEAKAGDTAQLWESHVLGRSKEYCQIERLANLELLPRPTGFTVYAFPYLVEGGSAGVDARRRDLRGGRMSGRLEGRVALVTGAGRGLGVAIAEGLAREGASVAVHYRSSEAGARETADARACPRRRGDHGPGATSPYGRTSSGSPARSSTTSAASTCSSTTSATWPRPRCRGAS